MRLHWFLLYLALALAGLVRLTGLEYMEWKRDETLAYSIACRIAVDHEPVRYGIPSSIGGQNPPGFPYLLAAFWPLTSTPTGLTALVGLGNVVALGLLARWCVFQFGLRVGLFAILLGAVAPWPVLFSRKLWNVSLLPLLGILFLSLHARAARTQRATPSNLALLCTAVFGWLYPPSLLLAPASVVAAIVLTTPPATRRHRALSLLPGLAAVGIVLGQFFLATHDATINPKSAPGRPGLRRSIHVARHALESMSALGALDQLGPDQGGVGVAIRSIATMASCIAGGLALGGVWLCWCRRQEQQQIGSQLLLIVFFVVVAQFLMLGFVSQRHYALLLLIPGLTSMALALDALEKRWRGTGCVLAFAIFASYLRVDMAIARSIVERGGAARGEYGVAFVMQPDPLPDMQRCTGKSER